MEKQAWENFELFYCPFLHASSHVQLVDQSTTIHILMVDIKLFRSLFLYRQYLWLKSAPSAFSTAKYSVSCCSLTLDKKLAMGHSDIRSTHSLANSIFSRGYTLPWSKYSLLKHFRHLQTHTPLFLSKATCSVIPKHDKHTATTPRKFKKLKKKKKKQTRKIHLALFTLTN